MSNHMGKRIKQRRKELGLSQDALARRMGYTDRSIIAKFETGRSVPDGKLPELAAALETTPAYLLGTLQEKLDSLDITVEEDAFGNAVITDRRTGQEQLYSKPDWIELQEQEDFRKIFQNPPDKRPFPDHLIHVHRKSAESEDSGEPELPDFQNMSDEEFEERWRRAMRQRDHKTMHALHEYANNRPRLSAASFQETAKVLSDAEIKDRVDGRAGLGKSVILGKLIPAGTGIQPHRINWAEPESADASPLPAELLARLRQLTPEELTRVDAFVQGLLSARDSD